MPEATMQMRYPFPVPPESPFGLQNLPFGIFSTIGNPNPRPGIALGDFILDLRRFCDCDSSLEVFKTAFNAPALNEFSRLPREQRLRLRTLIQTLLQDPQSILYATSFLWVIRNSATMYLPFFTRGFSDFMCSLEHVSNVGRMAGQPRPPDNFFNLPLAYNGRSSSLIVSGTPLRRPWGIISQGEDILASHAPCQRLDFEMELGVFLADDIPMDKTIPASEAHEHVFGFVLLNDWSSRDIQFLEMLPLGPFNGKSSGTSISPWVVTTDALKEAGAISEISIQGLDTGKGSALQVYSGSKDVRIQVSTFISRNHSTSTPRPGEPRLRTHLCTSDSSHLYWSPFQMVAHHTLGGCGLSAGDLIGTGTISSSVQQIISSGHGYLGDKRMGCLQELTVGGTRPITLDDGSQLTWLEDGDEVIMVGWAGQGESRIGFGELVGTVLPARTE